MSVLRSIRVLRVFILSMIIIARHLLKIERSLTSEGGNLCISDVIEKYANKLDCEMNLYHSPSEGAWCCLVRRPSHFDPGNNLGTSTVIKALAFSSKVCGASKMYLRFSFWIPVLLWIKD